MQLTSLSNLTHITVNKFDRVAQLIPTKIIYPKIKVVDELPETKRGSDGFGSTGK